MAKRSFFLYRYDGQGRVIESQVPDGGVSEYVYDAVGRLTSSNRENSISYDANGNVRSLRRLSAMGTTIANLSMSYTGGGNRLASVTNTGTEDKGTFSYSYDSSGNLTTDGRNRLQIQTKALTPVSSPVWSSPS